MTGDLDPLAAVLADAARLDALADASLLDDDPAVLLLSALRGDIDLAVASSNTPDLRRDAALLDALAAGVGLPRSVDPAMELLQSLRAAVDGVTAPAAVDAPPPATPLVVVGERPGLAARRRRRALRTGVAAGSVALALSMSGVAAAAYDSHPGGSLYGLRSQTFGRTDDDPVAAEELLTDLRKQVAVAGNNPVAAAKARADVVTFNRYVAAEHNPVVQRSIAASASVVVTTVAALPAPPVVRSHSPHPADSTLATRPAHSIVPSSAAPVGQPTPTFVPPEPAPTPAAPGASPDASPGALPTASPSTSEDPTGTPTSSDSPTDTPSATSSSTGSPAPGDTPSGSPAASTAPSATSAPSVSAASTIPPVVVRTPVVVKPVKPKAKPRKKKVTATLMTAQLPSSGLPQR